MAKIKCLSCGSEDNQEGDGFCGDCGARLGQPTPVVPVAQAEMKPVAPISTGEELNVAKIKCLSCGCENNQAGDVFCGDCGAKLAEMPSVGPAAQSEVKPVAPVSAGQAAAVQRAAPVSGKAKLVVKRTGRLGHEFVLDQEVMNVGRWDASSGVFPEIDLSQDDPATAVSRRHAKIVLRQGEYFLEDVGSLNGTCVNKGHRLSPGSPQRLQNGDEIIMGRTLFAFMIQ